MSFSMSFSLSLCLSPFLFLSVFLLLSLSLSLVSFRCLFRGHQSGYVDHFCEQYDPDEGADRPDPVEIGEGVVEIEYGQNQTDKLPQRHYQGDRQSRALRCQDKHTAYTDVSGGSSRKHIT